MLDHIHVNYKLYNTDFMIHKVLEELNSAPMISFDLETQSLYSLEQKAEAKDLLKGDLSYEDTKLCKLVARSSGLSNPRLVKATHFNIAISSKEAIILIAHNRKTEELIFNWLVNFSGKTIVHNSLFDLKIMYERVGKLPIDYEDTQLLAKSLINDVDTWQAKTGLKELMGSQFNPKWTLLVETYDIVNYKDKDFLEYCAIDACATFLLWQQLQKSIV